MTFDVKAHYQRAVIANVQLWRQRLLAEPEPDRWQPQQAGLWQAVAAGLDSVPAQPEAAALAAALLPMVERWGVWLDWLPLLETAVTLNLPPDLHGRLLLAQGRLYALNRNFSDALRVQETALALADAHQLAELAGLAHYHLTNAYLGDKNYSQARQHGAEALRLLSPPQPVSPTSINQRPYTANRTNFPDSSPFGLPITDHRSPLTDDRLPLTDHGLPITDHRLPLTDDRLRTLASLHNALGLIELETGAFAASEAQFRQALAHWSGLHEPTLTARTWLNLGVVYYRQNHWAEAKQCYQQGYAVLAPTASVVDKLKVLNGLGTLHYVSGEFAEAERVFRQGLAEARPLPGLFHLRGSLTHNLGNTLLALGRGQEARLCLERSITLWQQANDAVEQANSTGTLAECYEQQEEWGTAVTHYDAALHLLAAYPDHQWAQKLTANFQTARARCAALNSET